MAPKFAVNIHHDAADLLSVPVNFMTSGPNTVVVGIAGKLIRIYKIIILVDSGTNISFQDASNALSGPLPFSANEGMVLDFDTKPWFTTRSGNDFVINSTNAVQVSGTAYYTQEP